MNPKQRITILLVDSEESSVHAKLLAAKHLIHLSCHIKRVATLKEALDWLTREKFQLVIADLFLPDSNGLETFERLQEVADFIPIVIVSRGGGEELALQVVAQGAQDFLPISEMTAQLLGRVVQYAIERHHLQESLRTLSLTDELTGLYNRRGFALLVKQQMELALRMRRGFYLFFLDLDYLKTVNDTFGHQTGDQALADTAEVLRRTFRRSDIVARIGGDEFAVVSIHVPKEKGDILKLHLEETVAEFNARHTRPYTLSLSIGMSYFDPAHPHDLDTLLAAADENLYLYKRHKLEG